jgi:hypothetical protein
MPYQIAAFREGDGARLEVSYAIARRWIAETEADGFVHLENGLFAFDDSWRPALRKVQEEFELPKADEASPHSDYLLSEHTVRLAPGEYLLSAEVRDPRTKTIGQFRENRRFPGIDSSFAMSDLLLAREITLLTPDPQDRADLAIVPDPLAMFERGRPVLVYFEIYGLTRDELGRTSFDVTYEVGRPEDEDVTSRTRGKERDPLETSVTSRYEGVRVNELTFLGIDVASAPPGWHDLTVRVVDVHSGGSDERSVRFMLME